VAQAAEQPDDRLARLRKERVVVAGDEEGGSHPLSQLTFKLAEGKAYAIPPDTSMQADTGGQHHAEGSGHHRIQ
jgi:hypothetical protein